MTTKPTPRDRCVDCGDRIDPDNYGRSRYGFYCVPCDDAAHEYSTTAHDQDTQP